MILSTPSTTTRESHQNWRIVFAKTPIDGLTRLRNIHRCSRPRPVPLGSRDLLTFPLLCHPATGPLTEDLQVLPAVLEVDGLQRVPMCLIGNLSLLSPIR